MKKILLMMLVLNSFGGCVLGSEKILFNASIIANHFPYDGNTDELDFQKFNIETKPDDLFLSILFVPHETCFPQLYKDESGFKVWHKGISAKYTEVAAKGNELSKAIPCIPLRYCLSNDGEYFQRKGDILFSFTRDIEGNPTEFKIVLASDFDLTPTKMIEHFRTAKRVEEIGQQPVLSKLKQNQKQQESTQQSESSYFPLSKLLFGGSIAAIIACLLYQRFYAAAH